MINEFFECSYNIPSGLSAYKPAVTKSGTGTRGLGRRTWDLGLGDVGKRGSGDVGTRGRRDAGTRGRGDSGTRGRGDAGTRGLGDVGREDVGTRGRAGT